MSDPSEGIGVAVGWIVGLAAAGGTAWFLFSGGGSMPAGRYPIVLLALIFLGPPIVAGGIAGGVASLIVSKTGKAMYVARQRTKAERHKSAVEHIGARLLMLNPSDLAKGINQEILPALAKNGLALEAGLTGDGRTVFHLAASAGNEGLVEALAQLGPIFLARSNDGKLFLDVAPPGNDGKMLEAFIRGYTHLLEKRLSPADLPLTDDERALLAKWISDLIEPARPSGRSLPTLDLAAFVRDKLSEARAKKGSEAYDDGRPADAIEPFNSAIRLDPNYWQAFRIRGIAYAALGNNDSAFSDFNEAIRLKPDDATAYYRRALLQETVGAFDKSRSDYDDAIRIDPKFASAYNARGSLFFNQLKHIDRAIIDFRQALKLDPNYGTARSNLDIAYGARNANDAALEAWNEAIVRNPQDAKALTQRGYAYFVRGEYDCALADLNEVLRLSPEDTYALSTRGAVRIEKGDLEGGLADNTECIRLVPKLFTAHFNSGYANERLGRKDAAIASYRKALELEPGKQTAISALKRLGVDAT
jgi:tetratricopeptide (TPR) repeat protein